MLSVDIITNFTTFTLLPNGYYYNMGQPKLKHFWYITLNHTNISFTRNDVFFYNFVSSNIDTNFIKLLQWDNATAILNLHSPDLICFTLANIIINGFHQSHVLATHDTWINELIPLPLLVAALF